MKKFWEKHDLFKVTGIMILITALLTWVIPQGSWSGTEFTVGEITRVGIFDFFTYGLLGMYYFTVLITFLFVLGGFYQVLAKTTGYQNLTNSIAKIFKGKEILFVLVVSFIIALLSAVMNEYYVIIAFIPFIITIMSKMKLDKITGFVTTFGALLVGFIGSIYGSKVSGINVSSLGLDHNDFMWVKLVLFGVSYLALNVFNILNLKKELKKKKGNEIEELFVSDTLTKKKKAWPVAVIFGIFTLVTILAYLPWVNVFQIPLFTEITTWIKEVEIFGAPIFQYLLGNIEAFGNWDIFGVQILMLIASLIVKWTYKISFDDFFTAYGEGFVKAGKLVVMLLAAFIVLEFTVMFPVLPTIVDYIMSIASKFNVFLGTISGLVAGLFTTEYQYTISLIGTCFTGAYADLAKQVPIMLQATYGIASYIAPSSAVLLIGLSYFNITYKEWFKFIWKFLVLMIAVIIILMFIII